MYNHIVNGEMLLRSDRRFSNFPFHTKTVLENIHINKARGYYTKLSDTKNSDIPGNERDELDYFRYLALTGNFLIFDCAKFSSARNVSWVNMGL